MDDKQNPEAKQEEDQQKDQAQAGQATAAEGSPEEMEAKLQAALAQMPRDEQGALVDPKTNERLADGVYAIATPDGQEVQFEVKNAVQAEAPAAGAEQTQPAQAEAGMAEQPGLADLPASGMPGMTAPADASPEAKAEVLDAMGAAVGARVLSTSGFDVQTGDVDAELIKAVDRLARGKISPADFAPDANAPREPSHAERQAGEVVGKHTGDLAKAGVAAGAGGPTR